jgi:hypothetical protein
MVVRDVEFYEVEVKFLVRKCYWDLDNPKMTKKLVADKVQQGLEVPLENIVVRIKE